MLAAVTFQPFPSGGVLRGDFEPGLCQEVFFHVICPAALGMQAKQAAVCAVLSRAILALIAFSSVAHHDTHAVPLKLLLLTLGQPFVAEKVAGLVVGILFDNGFGAPVSPVWLDQETSNRLLLADSGVSIICSSSPSPC